MCVCIQTAKFVRKLCAPTRFKRVSLLLGIELNAVVHLILQFLFLKPRRPMTGQIGSKIYIFPQKRADMRKTELFANLSFSKISEVNFL